MCTANSVVDAGGGNIEGSVPGVSAVERAVGTGGRAGLVAPVLAVAVVVVHLVEP